MKNNNNLPLFYFQKSVYLWLIYNYSVLMMDFSFIWGDLSLINTQGSYDLSSSSIFLYLVKANSTALNLTGVISIIVLSIIGLFYSLNIYLRSALFFWVLNIDRYAYPIMDGGNNLIHIFLFLLIFFSLEKGTEKPLLPHSTNNSKVQGTILFLIKFQVCLVYACASLHKLTGELWPKGMAIFYTLSFPDYSVPIVYENIGKVSPLLYIIPSYIVLLFQLTFPILAWSKKIRLYLLFLGVFIHLGIALVIGLPSFGFVLIISYIAFLSEEEIYEIKKWIKCYFSPGEERSGKSNSVSGT